MRSNWILPETEFWFVFRKIPMGCNWNLAETKFGIVLEEIRWDAVEFFLRHNLELSENK